MTRLAAERLRVEVPGRVLIDGLDIGFGAGEFVALLGGNGTGKSLLMRTLAGLRPPGAGRVLLEGTDIGAMSRREIARRLGLLPQDPESVPQGSVAEAVLLGRFAQLGFWEPAGKTDVDRVGEALASVGLEGFGERHLGSLSGGEQRRATIARLLVQSPSIYLLDEPTNHLDPAQQLAVLETMRALADQGATVIASLHEPNLALRFADRALLLAGDGACAVVEVASLGPEHLRGLYGVPYSEHRVGSQRFMAPD